jgi:hypothetical protein
MASASDPAQAGAEDATTRGRNAFERGVTLARAEQWGDALLAFEDAALARDAPLIQFNIGYCERALGRYVAARTTLQHVLRDTTGLDPAQIEDTKAYLAEFDHLLVRVSVVLDPANAALAVDGRPLVPDESASDTYLVSFGATGAGTPMNKTAFVVTLDPGAHVFHAMRSGHEDAVLRKSYRPAESAKLDLHLDLLPATVAIRSEPAAGLVLVDKREVGIAPIEFQRPAGSYKLRVALDRYETYSATLDLQPGQRVDLTAKLNPDKDPLTKKWWFWSGVAATVAGGVVLTYALTRPTPQPPPYDGGSANWVVHAQSVRW